MRLKSALVAIVLPVSVAALIGMAGAPLPARLAAIGEAAPAASGASTDAAPARPAAVTATDANDPGIAAIEEALVPPMMARGKATPRRGIETRMKTLRVPAVSIAVLRDADVRWARAYGVADVSTGRKATTGTRFQAASISKPVAALAAMRLVEQGQLTLDDDVNAKLRTWKVPEDERTVSRKVTVRRLLSHSAGLSIDGFPGYAPGQPLPTLPQILDGQAPANTGAVRPTAWPGLQYRYSGGGYEVLELLMTDVTGQRFPELVKQRVLDPIGMRASTYDRGAADGDYANGHKGDGRPVAGGAFVYPELAAAGLWTTPTDIARLGAALQQALRGGAVSPVVSQATAALMLSEQMKPGGLGFQLRDGATRWFLHSGMNEGFQSFALFNTAGDGVVIMTNADTGLILAYEIVATLARAYGWTDYLPEERPSITLTADALREYAGTYPTERFGTIVVEAKDDRLIVRTESRPPIEFFPESSRLFFPETHGLKAKFNRGWFGGVSSISFGRLVVAKGSNALPAAARTN